MSTSELLERFKALAPRERRKLAKAIRALEEEDSKKVSPRKNPVGWPDVEARARSIFGDRVLPNLVLLEREEESL